MCAKIELSLLRTEIHPSFTSAVIFPIFYGSGNQNKTNKQGFQTTIHNCKKMPTICKKNVKIRFGSIRILIEILENDKFQKIWNFFPIFISRDILSPFAYEMAWVSFLVI